VSSGDQLARAALPEPGPVPPVDVHVAPQSLRRPELPPAVAAGVRGRRRWWHRPRGEATGGQAEVVTRRPRRRLLLLEAAAVVVPLHCWGGGVVWLSYSSLSYTSEMQEPDEQSKQRHTHMVSTKAAVSIYNLRAGNANSAGSLFPRTFYSSFREARWCGASLRRAKELAIKKAAGRRSSTTCFL
jgi:hypothetical protein